MIPFEPCAIAKKVTKMASRQEEAAPPTTTSETATPTSSTSSATESPSNNGRATDSVDAADAPQTPDDDSADARGFNLSGYRAHLPPGGGSSHGGSPRHHPRDQLEFSTVTSMDAEQYDLSEGARIAVVFNHERFSNGLADRRGTQADCEVKITFAAFDFLSM